jgi:hypothetical protein
MDGFCVEKKDSSSSPTPLFVSNMLVERPGSSKNSVIDYTQSITLLIDETDGRPIVSKKASVTGRHNGSLLLYRFVSPVVSSNSTSI